MAVVLLENLEAHELLQPLLGRIGVLVVTLEAADCCTVTSDNRAALPDMNRGLGKCLYPMILLLHHCATARAVIRGWRLGFGHQPTQAAGVLRAYAVFSASPCCVIAQIFGKTRLQGRSDTLGPPLFITSPGPLVRAFFVTCITKTAFPAACVTGITFGIRFRNLNTCKLKRWRADMAAISTIRGQLLWRRLRNLGDGSTKSFTLVDREVSKMIQRRAAQIEIARRFWAYPFQTLS